MIEPIHVGYTGTRWGMTQPQRQMVTAIVGVLAGYAPLIAHDGCCIGGDREFRTIAIGAGARIIAHPPIGEDDPEAFAGAHEIRIPLKHLKRNDAIVATSRVMIAGPYEDVEQPRGGTWYTVRRARKAGCPLALVLPTATGARVLYSGEWPRFD